MTALIWTLTFGCVPAIALVLSNFAEFQSIRQVHLWLRQEGIDLPAADYGPQGRHIVWKPTTLSITC